MRSAVVAKSLTDLTRRKTRTAFAVASLLALLALVTLVAKAVVERRLQSGRRQAPLRPERAS